MKLSKVSGTKTTERFSPFVQITAMDNRIAVMFDSDFAGDTLRMPRVVMLPRPPTEISCEVEGGQSEYRVKLLASHDGSVQCHDLATIATTDNLPLVDVRQAVASSFGRALQSYLRWECRALGAYKEPQLTSPGMVGAVPGEPAMSAPITQSGKGNRSVWRSAAVVAAVAVVGFCLAYGLSARTGHAADPIQAAVAENMAQDPASITAQVELTKQTLRSMGLDPGRAGDLGCLAAQ
ncbi:hypothetical protein [Bordetella flabilis]|uniref:Uncharacterized protein n=1 Tax=Bordetella flabilis TaxID=463014 RepID=A0A193GN83_9BORD|nr:hypothetical protein [Bordetella flabilis]ANN80829.1 hypothetical protein BAU07_26240 [Bordetella flabilis]